MVAVRLSSAGAPLAVLSDCSAYALHLGLRSWLRVADETHTASAFASALPAPLSGLLHPCCACKETFLASLLPWPLKRTCLCAGDLSRLQAQASAVRPPDAAVRLAAVAAGLAHAAVESRAHLESNVAAALVLDSTQEYRRWLLTYVRQLAGARGHLPVVCFLDWLSVHCACECVQASVVWRTGGAEESRLREVCFDLLGPPRYSAESHALSACAWSPDVLGLDKRELLQEVLREVSRNRANQRLVNEVTDILAGVQQHDQGGSL